MHVLGGDQDRSHAEVNRQQAENAVLAQRRLKILRVAGAGACASAGSMSAGNPASTSPAASPGNRRYKNLCMSISPEGGTQPQPGTLMGAENRLRYPILRIGRAGRYPISAKRLRRCSACR